MKAFMTNGTLDFLQKLNDKYPTIPFYLMNSGSSTLAYYEDTKKKAFSAGREYEVISKSGTLKQQNGYVVMNNIPVTDDGTAMFEERFKQRAKEIDGMPGFEAFRLLKPKKGNTYVVFTQWQTEQDFDNWKNSKQFKEAHKEQASKPPAYFADRPFVTSYHMFDQDK